MVDTSIEAYRGIVGSLNQCRAEVLEYLKAQNRSFTGHELDMAMLNGDKRNGDSHKRLSELEELGLVIRLGKRKCSVSGNTAYEWVHVDATNWKGPKEKVLSRKLLQEKLNKIQEWCNTTSNTGAALEVLDILYGEDEEKQAA